MFDARDVIQFAEFYPVGHRSTNYAKWFESDVPYPIKFKSGYEPYVLVSRKLMPWYDERFRGYGWDKVCPSVKLHCNGSMLHCNKDLFPICNNPQKCHHGQRLTTSIPDSLFRKINCMPDDILD